MSKTSQVAVPTSADAYTDMTAIVVPVGAKSIKRVKIGIAVDEADPAGARLNASVRLTGAGLDEQNPHEYVGPAGNIAAKTTSGAYACELNFTEYDVDIPVKEGGTITPQAISFDEVITAGTISIQLDFSSETAKAKNSMAQQVNAAMTTSAGAWSTIDTMRVPMLVAGKAPTKIKKIAVACPTDQATIALLRCALRVRATGSGIAESGDHEYLGPHNGTGCNTAGILGYSHQIVEHDVDIPVNAGGDILWEQYLTTETPTAGTVIVGVLYE